MWVAVYRGDWADGAWCDEGDAEDIRGSGAVPQQKAEGDSQGVHIRPRHGGRDPGEARLLVLQPLATAVPLQGLEHGLAHGADDHVLRPHADLNAVQSSDQRVDVGALIEVVQTDAADETELRRLDPRHVRWERGRRQLRRPGRRQWRRWR